MHRSIPFILSILFVSSSAMAIEEARPPNIAAGRHHSCALTGAAGVKCWGLNGHGQLGDGTTTERHTPEFVDAFTRGAAAVAAGLDFHTCALTAAGGVKCWGANTNGRLGDGTTQERHVPDWVDATKRNATAVAVGGDFSCALTAGRRVKCWGWNSNGQLGDGTTTERLTPIDVLGLGRGVTAIAAGLTHACAVTARGGVKCWGWNGHGQLGDGTTAERHTADFVDGLTRNVVDIAAGAYHTCAVTAGGGVKCWGRNVEGQVGDGTREDRRTPEWVDGLKRDVDWIAAGGYHTCAVTINGGVKCWGWNGHGQLGDGTTADRDTPDWVDRFKRGANQVTAGYAHTCARLSTGRIRCWGSNGNGQLGDGTTEDRHTPVFVDGF